MALITTLSKALSDYAFGVASDMAATLALANALAPVVETGVSNVQYVDFNEDNAFQKYKARRAIGAKQKDIIRQFLTEAVLISIMGGLLGIIFGVTLAHIIASAAGWSTVVTTGSIAVAFGVSCGIGLVFGIYPAMQAARLDPIEAIRYE
jgi:ABC-type antimicrobial peptide transport system permease subunit